MKCVPITTKFLITASVLIAIAGDAWCQALDTTSSSSAAMQVDAFLAEYDLTSLQITATEQRLDRSSGAQRKQVLVNLSGRYERILFADVDGEWTSENVAAIYRKSESLIAANPHFNSDRLRLAMRHHELRNLETLFFDQVFLPESSLDSAAVKLVQSLTRLRLRFQRQTDVLEKMVALDKYNSQARKQLRDRQRSLAHCDYLLGWAKYFQAGQIQRFDSSKFTKPIGGVGAVISTADENAIARRILRDAETHFRRYLRLGPYQRLNQFTAADFSITDDYRHHGLLGLGCALRAIASHAQADRCFAAGIQTASGPVRQNNHLRWDLVSQLIAGQFEQATLSINQRHEKTFFYSRPDTLEMIVHAVGTRYQIAKDRADDHTKNPAEERIQTGPRDRLIEFAMDELIFNWHAQTLQPLLPKFGTWLGHRSFKFLLGNSYVSLHRYENAANPADLKRSIHALEQALAMRPQAGMRGLGRALFLLACCRAHENEYQVSVEYFQQAATILGTIDRPVAAESWWRSVELLQYLQRSDEIDRTEEISDTLDRIIRQFPDTRYSSLAQFERLAIELKQSSPERAIEQLDTIAIDHPSYGKAQLAIIKQLSTAYRQAFNDEGLKQQVLLEQLRDRVYVTDRSVTVAGEVKVEASFQLLAVLIQTIRTSPQRQQKLAAELTDRFTLVAGYLQDGTLPKNKTLDFRARLHYYKLISAPSDPAMLTSADASWLIHAGDSHVFYLPALLHIGQAIESFSHDELSTNMDLRTESISIYRRLTSALSATKNKDANNFRVARIQLAKLLLQDHQLKSAKSIADKILHETPDEIGAIRLAAQVEMAATNYPAAAAHWQNVRRQTVEQSPAWLRASWNYIRCVAEFDSDKAMQIAQRLRLLHPNLSQVWDQRFLRLSGANDSGPVQDHDRDD